MSAQARSITLEEQIGQWRGYLRRRRAVHGPDVEELEAHLRDQVAALTERGLADDEAFLVAVKRLGNLDAVAREFAREHSQRLWKQLVIGADDGIAAASTMGASLRVVLALAVGAAVAIKVPAFVGIPIDDLHAPFYARNASVLVLPFLVGYFVWTRAIPSRLWPWLVAPFLVAAAVVNGYPFTQRSDTDVLSVLHLPIALWLVTGVAYAGGRWFEGGRRMDFVRYSGELFIYYVLIALGGVVLTGFTMTMFLAIGVRADWFAQGWLIPCGAAGALLVATWLVEAKQSVVENMAPVLTRLFTPLFTVVLLVFLITMAWTGRPIDIKREVLIAFDVLLALVVGLVLYAVSARDPQARPDLFDRLQLVLIVCALAVDAVALVAIASRISEFGFTPNRVSALGENLILLVNLAWSAWLYARFLRDRQPFTALEAWQTAYLPVYSAWAAIVVVVFPPLFSFN